RGPQVPENLLFRPPLAALPPGVGGKEGSLEGKALQTSQLRNSYYNFSIPASRWRRACSSRRLSIRATSSSDMKRGPPNAYVPTRILAHLSAISVIFSASDAVWPSARMPWLAISSSRGGKP